MTITAIMLMAIVFLLSSCKDDYAELSDTAYSTYNIRGYVMDADNLPVKNAMVVFGYDKSKESDPVMELISDTTYTDITGYYEIVRNTGIPVYGEFVVKVFVPQTAHLYRRVATRELTVKKTDYDLDKGVGRYGLAVKNVDINLE